MKSRNDLIKMLGGRGNPEQTELDEVHLALSRVSVHRFPL